MARGDGLSEPFFSSLLAYCSLKLSTLRVHSLMTKTVAMVAISGADQVLKIMLRWVERHLYLCDDWNSILIGVIPHNNLPGSNDQRHPYAVLK